MAGLVYLGKCPGELRQQLARCLLADDKLDLGVVTITDPEQQGNRTLYCGMPWQDLPGTDVYSVWHLQYAFGNIII